MKWAYETAPHTARENYRAASSSAWFWPARWSAIPSVLLADEPTGSLDFRTGEMIMDLIEDLHRSRQLDLHSRHPQFEFRAPCRPGASRWSAAAGSIRAVSDSSSRVSIQGRNYV